MTDPDAAPVLFVLRGNATAEETAAVVAVLAATRAAMARAAADRRGAASRDAGGRSLWCDRARLLHAPPRPGPGAWRASALPR